MRPPAALGIPSARAIDALHVSPPMTPKTSIALVLPLLVSFSTSPVAHAAAARATLPPEARLGLARSSVHLASLGDFGPFDSPHYDPVPVRDADASAQALARRAAEMPGPRLPTHVAVIRWGGLGLALAGALSVAFSVYLYEPAKTTEPTFQVLRAFNTAGWTALAVGGSAFALSWAFGPSASNATASSAAAASLQVSVGGIAFRGAF